MKRLLTLLSIALVVDTAAYAAITPLLPSLADEHDLSKTGAGLLTAAYPFGNLVAALPAAALCARIGPKRTVIAALSLLAVASVCFGVASSTFALISARFLQGLGAAAIWAGALTWVVAVAPRERRAEMIGTAIGAAIAGAVGGPILGAAAGEIGRTVVFAAFVLVPLGLLLPLHRLPTPPRADVQHGAWHVVVGDAVMRRGAWLMALPAMAFGAFNVLVPLRMDHLGAGALAIGATFLAAVLFEAMMSPVVGRIADRRGSLWPARVGLLSGGIVLATLPLPRATVVLALGVALAAPLIGMLWAPAMAMLSVGAERRGIDPALGFGVGNLAWSVGATVGGSASGALAEATADAVPYVLLAALMVATSLALSGRAGDPVVADRAG